MVPVPIVIPSPIPMVPFSPTVLNRVPRPIITAATVSTAARGNTKGNVPGRTGRPPLSVAIFAPSSLQVAAYHTPEVFGSDAPRLPYPGWHLSIQKDDTKLPSRWHSSCLSGQPQKGKIRASTEIGGRRFMKRNCFPKYVTRHALSLPKGGDMRRGGGYRAHPVIPRA